MLVGSMISGGCSSTNTWQCFKSRLDIVIGKLRLGSNCPGRFKLTGAWCEELLSQMKHAFLFLFPKGIGAAQDSDPIAGCRDLEASD